MNCKDKYTEKEIKEESERKFDINDNWPSMSQIKGPGDKLFYEFKSRVPVQDSFLKELTVDLKVEIGIHYLIELSQKKNIHL